MERPQNRHLKPFRPGAEWTGNAKGRPKGSVSITTLLKEAAQKDRICDKDLGGRTAAEALAEAMFYHAIAGNAAYMKEIINRLDGLIPDPEPQREASYADIPDDEPDVEPRVDPAEA